MAFNMIFNTVLRQLKYPSMTFQLGEKSSRILPQRRLLHLKVYDKDAGFMALREGNSRRITADEEEDIHIPKRISQHRIKRVNVETLSYSRDEIKNSKDDNPDVFGNACIDETTPDPGDVEEENFLRSPTRHTKKLRTKEYANLIKDHLNRKRVKDAIAVLEIRMIKEDRVKPENYIYNLLISGCAKAGYTRKTFSLFNKMRQRGLQVKGGTYTSLFNACANAPSAEDGLSRANYVREIMLEKGYEPNVKNYNAMIKAYGRWGDVKTAYLLADEMMEKDLEVDTDTFNFLLQACASDHEFGFRHCLLTWHKMLKKGVQPDFYTFSTVLRCVRDCSFGDFQTMEKVIAQILEQCKTSALQTEKQLYIQTPSVADQSIKSDFVQDPKVHKEVSENKPVADEFKQHSNDAMENTFKIKNPVQPAVTVEFNQTERQEVNMQNTFEIPNLLLPAPHLGSLLAITEVTKPHERLLLLGGLVGFLEHMKFYNITPGIETFTTLLEVIPPTNASEKQLISYIRKIGLKSDIDFFNILIKKRSMRFDYEGAKEVLSMIKTAGLHPDIVTYGVLALGCQTAESSRELIQKMRDNGVRMNIQILGAMLRQGCAQKLFPYICEILQITLDENVKPNDIFLRHLKKFYNQCACAIDARHPTTKKKMYKKEHANFCKKLNLWYEEQGIAGLKLEDAIQKIKQRPYQQYQDEPDEGFEDIKNDKLSRKRKIRQYIKKIKVNDLKGDDGKTVSLNRIQQKMIE